MPKVTRRKSKPKQESMIVVWKKVVLVSLPILALLFVINQSQGLVLGIKDFNGRKANTSISPRPTGTCKPTKINSVTFSSPCTGEKLGFQKVVYSCADGTSSTVSSASCGNPQELFEKVKKACNKNSGCKRPETTKTVTPTPSPEIEVEE